MPQFKKSNGEQCDRERIGTNYSQDSTSQSQ